MNAVTAGGVPTYFSTCTSTEFVGFPPDSFELGVSVVRLFTFPCRSSVPTDPGASGSDHPPSFRHHHARAAPAPSPAPPPASAPAR